MTGEQYSRLVNLVTTLEANPMPRDQQLGATLDMLLVLYRAGGDMHDALDAVAQRYAAQMKPREAVE